MPLRNRAKSVPSKLKNYFSHFKLVDFFTMLLIVFAAVLLVAVLVTYVMATQTKLSSYRTPIPLGEKQYGRGEMVQGYFEGRKIYDGRVIIERQLSCNDGYIEPLLNHRDGSKTVKSITPARTIRDEKPRDIALVPEDVSPGASCFVVFRHTACVPYLFGCYNVEYSYVSLPFTVEKTPVKDEPKTSVPEDSLPDDDKGLSPPPVNKNPDTSRADSPPVAQQPITPQSPPATVAPSEPSDNIPQRNDLQRLLRNINKTINDLPIVGGIVSVEEE